MNARLTSAASRIEWKAIGELGQFIRGRRFTKDDMVEDGIPCIHYGEIYTVYGTAASTAVSHVRRDLADQLRYAQPGDVVIAGVGETVKDVAKAVAWLGDEPVAIHDDTFLFRSPMNPKFVSYVMQTAAFNAQKNRHVARAKVKRIGGEALAKIRIPVPSIDEQDRIVAILDVFQGLEAELEVQLQAELDGRRRQYAHYRDSLLSFREQTTVEWVRLGEVGEVFRGKRFTKADYVANGGVGCIHYGEIYTDYGTAAVETVSRVRSDLAPVLRYATKGDVVLTDVGETVEDVGKAVAWVGDEDVAIHDHCYVFRSKLNPEFVSYYMQTSKFRADKARYIARTKVKTLLPDGVRKIVLPVPSPQEQERIVGILNRLDALVNDLCAALRAESRARRQQYEYYRDKLLTSDEAAA